MSMKKKDLEAADDYISTKIPEHYVVDDEQEVSNTEIIYFTFNEMTQKNVAFHLTVKNGKVEKVKRVVGDVF